MAQQVLVPPGTTMPQKTDAEVRARKFNSWCPINFQDFKVRSLDYKKSSKKEPSERCLYQVHHADIFSYSSKLDHLMQNINIPGTSHKALKHGQTGAFAGGSAPGNLPQYFIINFLLPAYDPPNPVWGKEKKDGDGWAFAIYLKMEDWVEAELALPSPKLASVRLLKAFLNATVEGKDSIRHRLKCIPRVINDYFIIFAFIKYEVYIVFT